MKATVTEIKHFAVHDGDGIRTTVFFKGCPLKCLWCHNPEGIAHAPALALRTEKCTGCGACAAVCPTGAHKIENGVHSLDRALCTACGRCERECFFDALTLYGRETTVEELLPALLADRGFYESSGGGVTLSGGECLTQSAFCEALLRALKAEGIHTAVDTSGFVPREALARVLPYTDVFLFDVKAIDPAVHRRCTGQDNAPILDNLRYLDAAGAKIEVRIPFVPHHNDGELPAIATLLSSLKNLTGVRVLPYHTGAGSRYAALGMENTLPDVLPTKEALEGAKAILREKGLRVID
ncbi:MAG: glycyl-radical enzyme activating protein [Clostridia bacterium]|nr:glycyl-radical enzyme activating protein [Clostridia bacterium]